MVTSLGPSLAPSHGLRLRVADSIEPLAAEWSVLAAASRNVFATPEWASVWHDVYGRDSRLRLVTAHDESDRLRVLVPLVISRRGPVRIARFIGHGVADILGPVAAPEDAVLLRATLEGALVKVASEWDVFLGERLSTADGWTTMPGATILQAESNPALDLTRWPDWEAYLADRTKKLRRELRHDARVLHERHGLVVRQTSERAALDADMDTLLALHDTRFGKRSSFAPREGFHRRFAEIALERGWLRLWVLEADGRPAAARFDFAYHGVYNAYNGGRDPSWSKLSVGLVLRSYTLRHAFDSGATVYRFLRGDESYKSRFGTTDDPLVTIALGRTWMGRRATGAALRLRHRRRLRHLVRLHR